MELFLYDRGLPHERVKLLLCLSRAKILKQSFRGVLIKRCSKKMQQIYRRVTLLHIFRTPKNTSGRLLGKIEFQLTLRDTAQKMKLSIKNFFFFFFSNPLFTQKEKI